MNEKQLHDRFSQAYLAATGQPADFEAEANQARFLEALTELSRRFGLGIGGEQPQLWVMESGPESDYERTYSVNDDGILEFK